MNKLYQKRGYLMEDFRLFHLRDAQGAKADYHYHEFYKLLFLFSGTGGYSIEDKRYLLEAGDIVLVANHCAHRPDFVAGTPYERIILYISPEFLNRHSTVECDLTKCFSGEYGNVIRPDESTKQFLFPLLSSLENALSDDRYGQSVLSSSILLRLLVEINRTVLYEQSQTPSPILPKNKRILEILRYLDAHLTEPISIDELAERFYLSRFHLMHQFKEETGTTIHNYLSNRRLFYARDLISQGHSATDACFLCGFQSYASFSRAYRKLFGKTPTGRKNASVALSDTFE